MLFRIFCVYKADDNKTYETRIYFRKMRKMRLRSGFVSCHPNSSLNVRPIHTHTHTYTHINRHCIAEHVSACLVFAQSNTIFCELHKFWIQYGHNLFCTDEWSRWTEIGQINFKKFNPNKTKQERERESKFSAKSENFLFGLPIQNGQIWGPCWALLAHLKLQFSILFYFFPFFGIKTHNLWPQEIFFLNFATP